MFLNQLNNLMNQQQMQQQTFNPSPGQMVSYGEPLDPYNLQITMPTGAAPSGNYGSPGQPDPMGLSLPSSGPGGQTGPGGFSLPSSGPAGQMDPFGGGGSNPGVTRADSSSQPPVLFSPQIMQMQRQMQQQQQQPQQMQMQQPQQQMQQARPPVQQQMQQQRQPQMQAPQQQRGVFTRPPQGTQNIGTRPNPSTAMNNFARGIQSGGVGQANPIRPLGRR
jgi:hypothetical protein